MFIHIGRKFDMTTKRVAFHSKKCTGGGGGGGGGGWLHADPTKKSGIFFLKSRAILLKIGQMIGQIGKKEEICNVVSKHFFDGESPTPAPPR
jgi:hypothetical protein